MDEGAISFGQNPEVLSSVVHDGQAHWQALLRGGNGFHRYVCGDNPVEGVHIGKQWYVAFCCL